MCFLDRVLQQLTGSLASSSYVGLKKTSWAIKQLASHLPVRDLFPLIKQLLEVCFTTRHEAPPADTVSRPNPKMRKSGAEGDATAMQAAEPLPGAEGYAGSSLQHGHGAAPGGGACVDSVGKRIFEQAADLAADCTLVLIQKLPRPVLGPELESLRHITLGLLVLYLSELPGGSPRALLRCLELLAAGEEAPSLEECFSGSRAAVESGQSPSSCTCRGCSQKLLQLEVPLLEKCLAGGSWEEALLAARFVGRSSESRARFAELLEDLLERNPGSTDSNT